MSTVTAPTTSLIAIQHEASTSSSDPTTIFGIFGVLVALIGIAIAVLQLRHMRRQRRVLNVFELP
jgi:protein-S-isoprenylcysteine O-methyltransferase Ste14